MIRFCSWPKGGALVDLAIDIIDLFLEVLDILAHFRQF